MFESISTTDGYSIVETDVRKLSCQMIEETLLLIKNIPFKVCIQDKTIKSMKVTEMGSNTEKEETDQKQRTVLLWKTMCSLCKSSQN